MLTYPKEFDVVDLDPHSSPSVFLDSAVQSMAGFLCALQHIWQFYLEAMAKSAIQNMVHTL
ncbi:putative tRNA (guanine(26)-N(2))-dimethyltransferase [Helianthus annuus]|nr:putative tRNA (guanine(26)-N(2))-dimethyltransferase [Helianthus annuus]